MTFKYNKINNCNPNTEGRSKQRFHRQMKKMKLTLKQRIGEKALSFGLHFYILTVDFKFVFPVLRFMSQRNILSNIFVGGL